MKSGTNKINTQYILSTIQYHTYAYFYQQTNETNKLNWLIHYGSLVDVAKRTRLVLFSRVFIALHRIESSSELYQLSRSARSFPLSRTSEYSTMTTITPQRRKTCTTRSAWTNANLGQPWMVFLLVVGLLMPSGRPDSFVAAETIPIPDWVYPYPLARTKNAVVGDTIEFDWPIVQTHNVYIHPTNSCDTVGAKRIGPDGTTQGPVSYLFTEADLDGAPSKTIFFACDIANHCQEPGTAVDAAGNQNLIVTLRPKPTKQPTKQPTKNPTKQPTKSPTKKPTNQPTPIPTRGPTRPPTRPPTRSPTYVAGGVAHCSLSLSLSLSPSWYIHIYMIAHGFLFYFFSLSLSFLFCFCFLFDAID